MDPSLAKGKKRKSTKVMMEYATPKQGFSSGYVAYFPSGFDPLRESMGEEEELLTEFSAYHNPKPFSRQKELVVRTEGCVDFVGSNYTGEASSWQPCTYLLGVFDKEKGSLKLMPLAGEKVFRMEPRIRGYEYGQPEAAEAVEDPVTPAVGRLKQRMLTEAFGSQKSRLREKRRQRATVNADELRDFAGVEAMLQEAAQNEELLTNAQALQQVNSRIVRNIPPYNSSASTPQEAYPLKNIIAAEDWDCLDAKELKAIALKSSKEEALVASGTYPTFVLNRLKKLKISGDNDGNNERAGILLYITHLIAFHAAPFGLIRKASDPWASSASSQNSVDLTEELGIPRIIVATFLKLFTSREVSSIPNHPGVRQRSKEQMELLVSYILVLGLIVDDFHTDPYDLAVELKMTVSQIKPYYQQLGCRFVRRKAADRQATLAKSSEADMNSDKQRWNVTLPVPLQFTAKATSRRQRRK